jgi:hypothetical protein
MASEDVLDRLDRMMNGEASDSRSDLEYMCEALAAEVRAQRARAERAERAERDKDELLEVRQSLHAAMMLEWRGVEHGCECLACGGAGVKSYPSTSTWRGGIGGQAFTTDVCDKCWGSGDRNNAWPSHRALVEACKGGRDHG